MHIDINLLEEAVRAELKTMGVPDDEAAVGAEMCVDAELRGHSSHGIRLLRNVAAEYAYGTDMRRDMTVEETPVSARVNGGFHLSWFVHRHAVDLLIRKARDSGIAIVSVANAGVSGALGHLAERAALAGLVAVAANSSPVTVAAPGSSVPSLGTNPIAVGVPRDGDAPVVLDMATSAIAFNEIMRRKFADESLPEGVAVGATGEMTTDAHEAIDPATGRGRILPFGGHRGYGLSVMVELMVAAGVTGRTGVDKRGETVLNPADFSGLYIAYRPDLVGDPLAGFASTNQLVEELETAGARIPGEASRRRRARCIDEGTVDVAEEALALVRDHLPTDWP